MDLMGEAAMNNAYHISHNVQVQYMTLGQHKLIESI